MRTLASRLAWLFVLATGAGAMASPPADGPGEADFEREVRPVLLKSCVKCHGDKKQESGLRLDARPALIRGGDGGPAIVPGDPAASLLIRAIDHEGDLAMPPGRKLLPAEVDALKRWVERGAPWPGGDTPVPVRSGEITEDDRRHWSFQPVGDPPAPTTTDRSWPRTEIDRFILARIEAAGIRPASPADRRALIRRATFDLTGLPPTPGEIAAFLADPAPDAFAAVVDRLLASPRYGERWGRHWLDVVRYADTAGETADFPVPEAGLYRDYVIDAFNKDKPFDRFVREQVAGDLIAATEPADRHAESVTATGFLATSRRFGFDPQNYQHLTIQDTIDTLGQSILGLSLGCARCHDHKFDPVSAADYYALYGIFDSTRYAFPGSEEQNRPRDFLPLVPPAEAAARRQAHEASLARLAAEIKEIESTRATIEPEFRAMAGGDGSFEGQRLAAGPGDPWRHLAGARVEAESQSPFADVFPLGSRGVRLPGDAANNAFVRTLPATYTPATHDRIHLNVDFRIVSPGDGAYRIYLGHGPGQSAAIELDFNGGRFFARSGEAREPVRELVPGAWVNLQIVADLDARTYSGTIGPPGDSTRFEGKPFSPGWDGVIDCVFVDGYGHRPGAKPTSDVDNLAIADAPFPPPAGRADAVRLGELRSALDALDSRRAEAEQSLAGLQKAGPYPVAYAVADGTPHDARIQKRGEPTTPGEAVPRRFLQVLGGDRVPPDSGSGRLALADWLTRPTNPLTARVMANRIWQHHFGRGLVATENDFGRRGLASSHPELLDHLARRFMDGGWSVKALHRAILLSAVYQQSGSGDSAPDLIARYPRRRLDAEEIRDAMLAISGTLDLSPAGPHPFPPVETWAFTQHNPFAAVYETNRRSVYLMTQRLKRHPFLALFDGPDPNASTPRRSATTVPTQALFFLNDPFVHAQASAFAGKLVAATPDDRARLLLAFETALSRLPSAEDEAEALAFLDDERKDLASTGIAPADIDGLAWSALARTLFARNEFLFVD
ncbi:PSD1 and planctomycete cytochrome C domain-containing protein [Tundrisphaera sp. TA3]|uniref:PSD1 and planctomycete cytochrome C domain-containing protein n=1 Tax=Tundrisphaera sp. TA3 TaxID=3435775 RepID=UPI003EBBD919